MSKKITPRGAVRIVDRYYEMSSIPPTIPSEWRDLFIRIVMNDCCIGGKRKPWREGSKWARRSRINLLSRMIDRLTQIRDGLEQYDKEREG